MLRLQPQLKVSVLSPECLPREGDPGTGIPVQIVYLEGDSRWHELGGGGGGGEPGDRRKQRGYIKEGLLWAHQGLPGDSGEHAPEGPSREQGCLPTVENTSTALAPGSIHYITQPGLCTY